MRTPLRIEGLRLPRRLAGLTGLGLFLLSAVAEAAEPPKFSELPTAAPSTVPRGKRPTWIAPTETVAGLFAVQHPFGAEVPMASRYATVVGDAKIAQAIPTGGGNANHRAQAACVTQLREGATPEGASWDENLMWETDVWPKSPDNPRGGITAVHAERIVEGAAGPTLETVEAWFDPSTRGLRLIGRSTTSLKQVASAIGGIRVFAFRTAGAEQGSSVVQFVVQQSERNARGSMTSFDEDGRGRGNNCGHSRVELTSKLGGGQSAVLLTSVPLPDATKPPLIAPQADKAKSPLSPRALFALGSPAPAAAPPGRETRVRDLKIHFSVSQASKDPEPVVALSFAWSGREQNERDVGQDEDD